MCLKTSDIVCASGPHFPGLYNDLQIFCEALIHMLNDGERVKADKGGAVGVWLDENPPFLFALHFYFWV